MSWSTNEKIPSVPVPVSIDACLELERRINQFRLNVFRRAAGMSKPIRNANVNRALWEIVECRQVDENVNMNPDQGSFGNRRAGRNISPAGAAFA